MDSTISLLNLIMTAGGFLLAVTGIGLAFFGYINLNRAHKIVDKKIKEKMSQLKDEFSIEFNKLQEATQKMIAGYNLHSTGNIDGAINLYIDAIKIYPKAFNAYPSLGYAYIDKGNYPDALLSFYKAAELNPDKVQSYNDLARIHALLNNKSGCIQNIKKMSELDPNSNVFLINDSAILNILTTTEIQTIYE